MMRAAGVGLVAVFALSVVMLACATVAKTQYEAQKEACVTYSSSRAEADQCLLKVDQVWNEAGSKPAAILDGGGQ